MPGVWQQGSAASVGGAGGEDARVLLVRMPRKVRGEGRGPKGGGAEGGAAGGAGGGGRGEGAGRERRESWSQGWFHKATRGCGTI